MSNMATKVDEEQKLSDKIAKLTINVQDQCNDDVLAESDIDAETCKTPTAVENRIPEPSTCPPAPRKRKGPPPPDDDDNGEKRIMIEKEVVVLFAPDHGSSN